MDGWMDEHGGSFVLLLVYIEQSIEHIKLIIIFR